MDHISDKDIQLSDDNPSSDPSLSDSSIDSSSSSSYSSKTSNSSISTNPSKQSSNKETIKQSKTSDDRICSQALSMKTILGTLNMKRLDLRHDPWLRGASFLEWISQLEIAFSSNKYTRTALSQYLNSNKIIVIKDKKIDLLVYTVVYAFLDKPTRISTFIYKNRSTKLLKILYMKCAAIDSHTKMRAKMAFLKWKITQEETAINFLARLEQKVNEARNYDIKISEKRFICTLLNNMKYHRHYKERIASFLTAFELNTSSITHKWIENEFYSLDEERMSYNRQRIFRESARFTTSNSKQINPQNIKNKLKTQKDH